MWHTCGPASWVFLLSGEAELRAARAVLSESARRDIDSPAAVTAAATVTAERLIAAVAHPDTGLPISIPFRMAAHVPVNALLLTAMLSARTPASSAAAQFANQCFNAAQFYANRNSSNAVPDASLAASFLTAVAASCGIAVLGARAAAAAAAAAHAAVAFNARAASRAAAAAAAVPFLAAAAGKPLQIGAMRSDEFSGAGVLVFDAQGLPLGRSTRAGAIAVTTTTLTRILYLAPMLWMPALQGWAESKVLPARAGVLPRAALFVLHSAFTSAVVTPACIALFAQRASVRAAVLEPAFASRGDELLFFNKGL